MKMAILFHEGCVIDKRLIERLLRRVVRKDPPKVLLTDSRMPEVSWVRSCGKRLGLEVWDSDELRGEPTFGERIRDWIWGKIPSRQLLIQSCDVAVVFWDGSISVKSLVLEILAADRTVIRANVDGS